MSKTHRVPTQQYQQHQQQESNAKDARYMNIRTVTLFADKI